MEISKNGSIKILTSEDYNYAFNNETGMHYRWGKTFEDDPDYSPHGPEIADIEISTVCHKGCKFCYKSNTGKGQNMSLKTFKAVLDRLPDTLTQIAFGIGDISGNPDMYAIFEHCRANDIVPNVTVNGSGITERHAARLASLCGAVAVSRYNPNTCYNAVKRLSEAGLDQVNIHQLLSEETLDQCFAVINDAATDSRLTEHLRAVVFLALKPVGRGEKMTPMRSPERYKELVDKAAELGVGIGFDSCSAPLFLKAMEGRSNYEDLEMIAEPCESALFSVYIDVEGMMHPCSFLEKGFPGIDVTKCDSFLDDVWNHPRVETWRKDLLCTASNGLVEGCRQCPAFPIY